MRGRLTTLPLAFGLLLCPALRGQKPQRAGNVARPPATRPAAPRPSAPRPPAPANPAPAPQHRPGEQIDRLMKMSTQERQKVLAKVPPERRQNIEKRLGELQKLPPATVARIRTRQELLNSFPPQRQNQIKRSVKQFLDMPEERRGTINQELQRMTPLPDDDRRAYMNTEEFRNRYTANEQQMMLNLIAITPPMPPKD